MHRGSAETEMGGMRAAVSLRKQLQTCRVLRRGRKAVRLDMQSKNHRDCLEREIKREEFIKREMTWWMCQCFMM